MNLGKIHSIYFIGIGGIGMSALARYMHYLGKNVSGYDRADSPITRSLIAMGIEVSYKDDLSELPDAFKNLDALIVYTPAVKRLENTLLDYFMSHNFSVIKRAELLGQVTKDTICFAVAGTHGKTTTSSILAHIFKETGVDATAFLGGIAENYQSNLVLGGTRYSVVEADEFDRSFLQLYPDYACITSVDADHLDIYQSSQELVQTFQEFGTLASKEVFIKKGLPIQGTTFGIEAQADYDATNIRIVDGSYRFDVTTPDKTYKNITLPLAGRHNVLNTMAALAMANSIGVSLQDIAKALLSYKGVHRRFSYRLKTNRWVLIDDYAHHPTEIDAVFETVKEMYPNEQILVVFQPHLYSRTLDFEANFVSSLARFDQVILLPIYPAREHPIEGVTSDNIALKIRRLQADVAVVQPEYLSDEIVASNKRIILMMGAGDIGEMITDVQLKLKQLSN